MIPAAVLALHFAIAGAVWHALVPPTVPYHDGSPRAVLWFDCEHEALRRYARGEDATIDPAACVARRGYPEEARRGPPEGVCATREACDRDYPGAWRGRS